MSMTQHWKQLCTVSGKARTSSFARSEIEWSAVHIVVSVTTLCTYVAHLSYRNIKYLISKTIAKAILVAWNCNDYNGHIVNICLKKEYVLNKLRDIIF